MNGRSALLIASIATLTLAGCGGSATPATNTKTIAQAPSPTTASSPSTSQSAATGNLGTTGTVTNSPGTTTGSTSTTPTQAATTTTTRATAPRATSPVICMTRVGLLRVGSATQTGTWQGTDPASRRTIYVDGPYQSPAAAKQSVSTLVGISEAAAGGVWEVSASLRGGTGPAVRRVAACLAGGSA